MQGVTVFKKFLFFCEINLAAVEATFAFARAVIKEIRLGG